MRVAAWLLIAVIGILLIASVARRARSRPGATGPATATPAARATTTPAPAPGVASQTATPTAALTPGDYAFEIDFGGRQRDYLLHVPPRAAAGDPLPLVLNLHGGASNAKQQRTFSQMDPAADRDGYLVAYPDGSGRVPGVLTWNAGGCCGYAMSQRIDDVGFALAVIDDLARRTPVDTARVYATGMSNGAMLAHRLAAEAADRIAAIAAVAGTTPLPTLAPSRAVPVMHIHSVDDPRAVYTGGLGPTFLGSDYRSLHAAVETTVERWAAFDGCPSTPAVEPTRHGTPGQPDAAFTATKIVYGPCRDGVEVVLWKLTASGHVWPGGQQDVPRILGSPTTVIDANAEMWHFFQRFSLPR